MIEESKRAAEIALNDCSMLEMENNKINEQNLLLNQEVKDLSSELETYKSIANKLARYVRVKSRNPPEEALSDILEVSDEENDDANIVEDAAKAKSALKAVAKSTLRLAPKPRACSRTSMSTQNTAEYYLMRSNKTIDQDNYHWTLTDISPPDDQLVKSEEFLLGEITDYPFPYLVYRRINLSDDKKNAVSLFLEITNGLFDEITAEKII
jgi:hypothetical protein